MTRRSILLPTLVLAVVAAALAVGIPRWSPPADVPGAQRFAAVARAEADGDVAALSELMTGGDVPALRAARELAARDDVPADLALRAAERVLALRIDEPLARAEERSLHLAIASLAEAAARPERAVAAYREALPTEAAILGVERLVADPYVRANLYLQAGLHARALGALGDLGAPSIEAPALRALGRHAEALTAYRRWLEQVPGDLDARYGVAWSHWYLGNLEAADAAFADLPGESALYGRGLIANRRGDLDLAVSFLRSTGQASRLWLATTLLERAGREAEAAEVYLDLAALASVQADDAAWRARTLALRTGDTAIARTAEAAIPDDSYFALRLDRAPVLPTRNDLEVARPEALKTAAWLNELDDPEGARAVLAFALRDARTEAEAVALGEALVAMGEYRLPQRAAAGLVEGGSEQLRTWRLAYPRAWPDAVTLAAKAAEVAPELVWAVMRRESAFYPGAISRSGAQGLMQVMPSTWDWLAELQDEPPADPFDPLTNIRYGTFYLGWLTDYFDGDLDLVVPSYNRGQGYISRLFDGPDVRRDMDELLRAIDALETREYLQAVGVSLRTYRELDRLEAELDNATTPVPGSPAEGGN